MKDPEDYCFERQPMDGDKASRDGENDGEITRDTIIALRQMAAVATSKANKLETLLANRPERELLTIDLPTVGGHRVARRGSVPVLPDAQVVRRIIRHRQMRKHCFDQSLFAEPAWDMLLDLTAATIEGKTVSVTSLCIASGVPATTALRWIDVLITHGLFERRSDPIDQRRRFVLITRKGLKAMAAYFEMIEARP